MFINPRKRTEVLADRAGISVSIPDIVVSTAVRIIVIGGLVGAISAMLVLSASARVSASTSASFQASSLRFKADVAAADIVRSFTDPAIASGVNIIPKPATQAVSLLSTNAAGNCEITTWRDVAAGSVASPELNLVTEKDTLAGACTTSTVIPAANVTSSNVGRTALLSNVSANSIIFKNIAGRTLTFDAAGNPALEVGVKPAGVLAEDWTDLRPQRIEVNVGSKSAKLTTYAKNASLVGVTSVVNYVQSAPALNYVSPLIVVEPERLYAPHVARSATVGTMYSNAREGVSVSFYGGRCFDMAQNPIPTIVTVTWTPSSPSGQSVNSMTYSKTLSPSKETANLAKVANGARGAVSVDAKCDPAAQAMHKETLYTQPVPATTLQVAQNPIAEKHDLSWTQVSSLPTSFLVEWSSLNGLPASNTSATTSLLQMTTTQTDGSVYGFDTDYMITPTVSTENAPPSFSSISNAWPTVPTPVASAWKTAGLITDVNGTISWASYSGSCPAGTSIYTGSILNRHGVTTYPKGVMTGRLHTDVAGVDAEYTVNAMVSNPSALAWGPSFALQGYQYGAAITTECYSAATNTFSPVVETQIPNFVTPIITPAAPKWAGVLWSTKLGRYNKLTAGHTNGYSTCRNKGSSECGSPAVIVDSVRLDYITTCPAGSAISNTKVTWRSWVKDRFGNWLGGTSAMFTGDGWELPDGATSRVAAYTKAVYDCKTPWIVSKVSGNAASVNYTVDRVE
jgi:hypothetical protein